jgi:hypothetical protein
MNARKWTMEYGVAMVLTFIVYSNTGTHSALS